mmetsp:Transcript_5096/g.22956  ORF Transcript_5096/g.22956 Transcript_5096/m.22956 type:complete len:205 (-) Transcript_5096:112-726(-)
MMRIDDGALRRGERGARGVARMPRRLVVVDVRHERPRDAPQAHRASHAVSFRGQFRGGDKVPSSFVAVESESHGEALPDQVPYVVARVLGYQAVDIAERDGGGDPGNAVVVRAEDGAHSCVVVPRASIAYGGPGRGGREAIDGGQRAYRGAHRVGFTQRCRERDAVARDVREERREERDDDAPMTKARAASGVGARRFRRFRCP